MFEKTKLIMLLVFTLCFLAYSVMIGKYYERIPVSRTVWLAVCVALTAAVVVTFIIDQFSSKRPDAEK